MYNETFLRLIAQPGFNSSEYLKAPGEGTNDADFAAWKNSAAVTQFCEDASDANALLQSGEPLPDVGAGNLACLFGCVFAYSVCLSGAGSGPEIIQCQMQEAVCIKNCNLQ